MSSTDCILLSVSLVGVWTLAFGLRGLIARRPFLFSFRWIFVGLALAVVPLFAQSPWSWLAYLPPHLIKLCLLVFMWFQMRGYSAQGVTAASFRQGLLAALERLNLPYEESISLIRLPTLEADLQVAAGAGFGQIRVKQRKHAALLHQIAGEMNDFYRSAPVETYKLPWVSYVVFGALLCVGSVTSLIVRNTM